MKKMIIDRVKVIVSAFILSILLIACQKEVVETYSLAVSYNETEGSIDITPNRATFFYDDIVVLKATPADGYIFESWSETVNESDRYSSEISIKMSQDRDITALFKLDEGFTLTVSYDQLRGNVTISPNKIYYELGDVVTLTAESLDGYEFNSWGGDISKTSSSIEINITDNLDLECIFNVDNIDQPSVKIEGAFDNESQEWNFEASVENSKIESESFVIKIDNQEMEFDNLLNSYQLNEISREDNDAPFSVEISHSTIETTSYSVSPKHFTATGNIDAVESEDGLKFTLTWTDLGASNYRAFRKLLTANTSVEGVYIDKLDDINYTFRFSDVWSSSNSDSSESWSQFWLWIVPVERVALDEIFSSDSYIELLGSKSSILTVSKD